MEADLSSCKADLVMKSEDLNRTTEELDTLRGVLEGFGEELSSETKMCRRNIENTRDNKKTDRNKCVPNAKCR